MTELVYRRTADNDLFDIYRTIARDHEPSAERFIQRIRQAVRRLADYPMSAPARPEFEPGVGGLVVGSYIVLHRVEPDRVLNLRVIHAARDIGGVIDADA